MSSSEVLGCHNTVASFVDRKLCHFSQIISLGPLCRVGLCICFIRSPCSSAASADIDLNLQLACSSCDSVRVPLLLVCSLRFTNLDFLSEHEDSPCF